MRTTAFLLVTIGLASTAKAGPTFLAKQYTRCTACYYSPTGGGLLTPYGRLLSHRELSTSGGTARPAPDGTDDLHGEQAFLFGALGNVLGPLAPGAGAASRAPGHRLSWWASGHRLADERGPRRRAAEEWLDRLRHCRARASELRRAERPDTAHGGVHFLRALDFYQTDKGVSIRAGRFMPAYGVAFADHTAYTRIGLDLDRNDPVYGLEASDTIGPSLVATIVGSAFYRGATEVDPKSGAEGIAFGFAPTSHVSIWTEADTDLETQAAGGRSYVVVNETSVEVYRGHWLKF
jgi:hypothetical protein